MHAMSYLKGIDSYHDQYVVYSDTIVNHADSIQSVSLHETTDTTAFAPVYIDKWHSRPRDLASQAGGSVVARVQASRDKIDTEAFLVAIYPRVRGSGMAASAIVSCFARHRFFDCQLSDLR